MKMKKMMICLLTLALLTACAPSADVGDTAQTEPTPMVTPDTAPNPTPTPEPTDTELDTTFRYIVEGMEMTVPARRHDSLLGYSMVYDHNMLTFEKYEDYYLYMETAETNLPALQIKISKETRTVGDVIGDLHKIGAEDSGYTRIDGCEARVLYYIGGNQYDDLVKTYSVVQAGKAVYLIEVAYFFEASEGAGSRLEQMVATMTFDDVPAAKELKILFRDKEMKDFSSVIGDVTRLRVGTETGAACRDIKWTSSNESVCTVVPNGGNCDVVIKGTGVAEVTVTCGDLSTSTVVRGKKSW